ncbi:HdeD family acid-resistance protein [Brevibacterium daeguense]|uniref:HdeD family acid-resistance protein n=1 Tax=Brevibacterium daeguense TaxID=909936 RepID=A0ABP8EJU2_9MICO|nr:HdeD family acid-resistance protein [Brevibacterium daeguense]
MSLPFTEFQRRSRTALIIQGILAIIVGIVMLVWPGPSVFAFIALFAAWLFIDGLFSIIGWFWQSKATRSAWQLISGILAILAAIVVIFLPGAAAFAIVILVAVWAIVVGIVQFAGAFGLRKLGARFWWALLISGALGVIVGILLLMNPGAGIISLLWLLAIFLIVEGIAAILLGIQISRAAKQR